MAKRSKGKKSRKDWRIELTEDLKRSALGFAEVHSVIWKRISENSGEQIAALPILLTFQESVKNNAGVKSLRKIQAASVWNHKTDGQRAAGLFWFLKSLDAQVKADWDRSSAEEAETWSKFTTAIRHLLDQVTALGSPAYCDTNHTAGDVLPDFQRIWTRRERYLAHLADLEGQRWNLHFKIYTAEANIRNTPPSLTEIPPGSNPESNQIIVSVSDLLGGPLALWAAQVGSSSTEASHLILPERWRELSRIYWQLHKGPWLSDFQPMGIDDNDAVCEGRSPRGIKYDLSDARRHLLAFLNAAGGFEKTARAKVVRRKGKNSRENVDTGVSAKTGKSVKHTVTISQPVQGGPLEVRVNKALVKETATGIQILLLAVYILRQKASHNAFLISAKGLRERVQGEPAAKSALEKKAANNIGNWRSSLFRRYRINLEAIKGSNNYKLSEVKLTSHLSDDLISEELKKLVHFREEELRKRKPQNGGP